MLFTLCGLFFFSLVLLVLGYLKVNLIPNTVFLGNISAITFFSVHRISVVCEVVVTTPS